MAYRGLFFALLLATLLFSCASAQDALYTVCYESTHAPEWTVFKLDPTTGVLSDGVALDTPTSALINTTLSNEYGYVGIHFHEYLHLAFTYYGGLGQGTLIRQLAANFESSNYDLVYPFPTAGGFTGDCVGNFYLAAADTGYVYNVQFNSDAPTAQVSWLRTLDPDSLGYDGSRGQFVSMTDSSVPDPVSSNFSDTAYLTTLKVSNLATTVQYLEDQDTDNSYLDGLEASPGGVYMYRLTNNGTAPGISTYTMDPFNLVSTQPLSPPLNTCFGLTVYNVFICKEYVYNPGSTSSTSSNFNGGATGANGVLLGRRKL